MTGDTIGHRVSTLEEMQRQSATAHRRLEDRIETLDEKLDERLGQHRVLLEKISTTQDAICEKLADGKEMMADHLERLESLEHSRTAAKSVLKATAAIAAAGWAIAAAVGTALYNGWHTK